MKKTKTIVIDARLYGPTHTGIGRYTKNLLTALKNTPGFNNYRFVLIVYSNLLSEIKFDLGDNFEYISTDLRHYTFSEQIFLPFLLYKIKPDLVHFTHFNKPILYLGKSVVTIHDLIKHYFKGSTTTTRSPIFYWPKYYGYLLLTFIIIKTSKIIVPSNYWKEKITTSFGVKLENITTTYEAVDPNFFVQHKTIPNKQPGDYIIYTGNLYPHKNVPILLDALTRLPDLRLIIIGARNSFVDKFKELVTSKKLEDRVEIKGYLKDEDFNKLYKNALSLVHPSFMEGFSLTGLEAMALGCPVISSNSSCLPEIYQNAVLYFDPKNTDQLVNCIRQLRDQKNRKSLIDKGYALIKKYSWTKTALQTFSVYKNILNETP